MGSAAIAALIAHFAFWFLLAYGWFWGEIKGLRLATFLTLWVGGLLGLSHVPFGTALFPSFVALLDIALVFVVVKGDLPIT